jgi:hypothetical protein
MKWPCAAGVRAGADRTNPPRHPGESKAAAAPYPRLPGPDHQVCLSAGAPAGGPRNRDAQMRRRNSRTTPSPRQAGDAPARRRSGDKISPSGSRRSYNWTGEYADVVTEIGPRDPASTDPGNDHRRDDTALEAERSMLIPSGGMTAPHSRGQTPGGTCARKTGPR